jgi:hypothetical protein
VDERLTITLRDVEFKGWETAQDGFNVQKGSFTGWNEGLTIRRDDIAIPGGDGSYDLPSDLSSRIVRFSGFCQKATLAELDELGRKLKRMQQKHLRDILRLSVVENGVERYQVGGLHDSGIVFTPDGGWPIANYSVTLKFHDVRKLGEPRTFTRPSPGEMYAWHHGNFGAEPRITVRGSGSGQYAVYGSAGGVYIVTRPLEPGHQHELRNGRLYVDGTRVLGGISKYVPWVIRAHDRTSHFLDAPGYSITEFTIDTEDTDA